MSFSDTGVLYGYDLMQMIHMNPATGAAITSSTTPFIYSSFGGNMAWASGEYYVADETSPNSLITIGTNGTVTTKGAFAGTRYVASNRAHALFYHANQMYMLNGLNLFTVNLANGALSQLGSISGVVCDNPSRGFAGTVSVSASPPTTPVPEIDPAGMGSVLALVAGALGLIERRRLQSELGS